MAVGAILDDIAYTFVPSLIVAIYLGVWLAMHGNNYLKGSQIFELGCIMRIATLIGPCSYVTTAPSGGDWVRVIVAIVGNEFACPVCALVPGGTLRLLGVRSRPH